MGDDRPVTMRHPSRVPTAIAAAIVVGLSAPQALAAPQPPAAAPRWPVPWPTRSWEVDRERVVPTVPTPPPSTVRPRAPAVPAPAPRPAAPVVPATPAASPPTTTTTPAAPAPLPTARPAAGAPPGVESTAPAPVAPLSGPASPAPAPATRHTFVGIYGDVAVLIDKDGNADWNPTLLGATLTHRPADWLRFHFDAALERGDNFGAQQGLVEVSPHPAFGVHAGLMLLPLGIINRLYEPPTYLSVDRPLTDQLIIPATWRELGAGIFGELAGALRYEVDVVSALDGAGFAAQAPLWGGRGNGDRLGIRQAAVVARVEVADLPGFACGAGGYYGPAGGGEPMLDGVSVAVAETDFRFRGGGFDLRAQYAHLFILNSYRVNDYLGLVGQSAVPKNGRGGYVQAGYDLLHLGDGPSRQELLLFAAYENVNPRSAMSPYNFNPGMITGPGETPPSAPSPARQFVRGGLVYRPVRGLAFKLDVQIALSGESPPPAPPMTVAGAPGTPVPLPPEVLEAARGASRLGLALAFAF